MEHQILNPSYIPSFFELNFRLPFDGHPQLLWGRRGGEEICEKGVHIKILRDFTALLQQAPEKKPAAVKEVVVKRDTTKSMYFGGDDEEEELAVKKKSKSPHLTHFIILVTHPWKEMERH